MNDHEGWYVLVSWCELLLSVTDTSSCCSEVVLSTSSFSGTGRKAKSFRCLWSFALKSFRFGGILIAYRNERESTLSDKQERKRYQRGLRQFTFAKNSWTKQTIRGRYIYRITHRPARDFFFRKWNIEGQTDIRIYQLRSTRHCTASRNIDLYYQYMH